MCLSIAFNLVEYKICNCIDSGGGGTSNQTQQQQQQGQANETRSPQQSEAGSGAQGQLPSAQPISGPITADRRRRAIWWPANRNC